MISDQPFEVPISRLQRPVFAIGVVALVVAIIGGVMFSSSAFMRGYLVGFLFCVSISLGSVGVLMIQYLTGGDWAVMIRRILQASSKTLPLVALMFIPVIIGVPRIYIWSHADVVQRSEVMLHKSGYLNIPFFAARAIIYFALWLACAYFLNRWDRENESQPSFRLRRKLGRLSGGGLVLLAMTITFAAVDWVMSIDPTWYSTIFGMSFMVGHLLAAFSFSIIILVVISRTRPVASVLSVIPLRDLGNLLLAMVMLWAYLSFSQFLLIWSGNLREEVTFYIPRMQGGWGFVSALIIIFHFFLPFFMLLMRPIKDRPKSIIIVAAMVLLMHFVDLMWIVVPSSRVGPPFHWLDVVTPIGVIGVWFAFFANRLKTREPLPMGDVLVREALSHG